MDHAALKPVSIAAWLVLTGIVLFVELPIYEHALATGVWMLCSIGMFGAGKAPNPDGRAG